MYGIYCKKRKSVFRTVMFFAGIIILAFVSAFVLSGKLGSTDKKNADTVSNMNIIKETESNNEILISETDILRSNVVYSCGHSICSDSKMDKKYINKTTEQIKAENPKLTSVVYCDGILELETRIDKDCPTHYSVKLEGNILKIYSGNTAKPFSFKTIDTKDLYPEEIFTLESGINFSNKEELLEFLEDFGS